MYVSCNEHAIVIIGGQDVDDGVHGQFKEWMLQLCVS